MQESGKGERVRSVAVYQGETMRPDRGLLSEARSGFEAALKELERISCCGGEEEEQWPLMNEIVGNDDDSIRVVRFLDGRRKVDSPASSPSPFVHTFGDMWPLRGGGDGEDIGCWANCESCGGGRRRKDSASEVHQNTTPKSKSDKCTGTETAKPHEYLQDLHLDAPRTPMVVTLGPTSDLDWLRFSYLLRNKNRVVSRADLAINVWDIDFDTHTNVIDVYINYLRNKVDKPFDTRLIETQVGMGYILKDHE